MWNQNTKSECEKRRNTIYISILFFHCRFPAYTRDETISRLRAASAAIIFHFPHTCEMRLINWENVDWLVLSFPAYVRDETCRPKRMQAPKSFHFPHTCEMRLDKRYYAPQWNESFISRIRARWDIRLPQTRRVQSPFISRIRARWDEPASVEYLVVNLLFPACVRDETQVFQPLVA